METNIELQNTQQLAEYLGKLHLLSKPISGTYKNSDPAVDSTILELRVDVDGRRPQQRISGDVFKKRGFKFFDDFILTPGQQFQRHLEIGEAQLLPFFYMSYEYSFVVENVTESEQNGFAILSGPIVYYNDPARTDETIEIEIKRVSFFKKPANAVVRIYKSGLLIRSYCLPKISQYFRSVTLEIDRFQGTAFPPSANTDIDPSPPDLPAQTVSTGSIFRNAGIDLRVDEDDVLNDPDSADPGDNWDEGELHDLMEDRFDRFANTLQWNTYGVVVPKFGNPNYNSGYYGTMFDWGGWQVGDSYFRQGAAIAEDAIRGRTSGTLYDTDAKKDRLLQLIFCHEIGHSFNLPHTWQRGVNADSASESFMNYAWGYTGGAGGEEAFWTDFRWEFDDVELIWMRHQDRNDVIFGGNDWIGNNLSIHMEPEAETANLPLQLKLDAPPVIDFAEPLRMQIKLTNVSKVKRLVVDRLDPEDHFVTLYIRRPNGEFVRYVPPVHRMKVPGDLVELDPGESIQASVQLSFGARGHQFQEPGEYRVRAYYGRSEETAIFSRALRLRVAAPTSRQDEELAYLLFDLPTAKFLYFEGSERYPKVVSNLEEAVRKYQKTNPRVVRHLRAALGIHASRTFKRVETRKGTRVVIGRKPKFREAISHLKEAVAEPPRTEALGLDDARYAQLAGLLAQSQTGTGDTKEAGKTLEIGVQYLTKNKAGTRILDELESDLKKLVMTKAKPARKAKQKT